MADIPAPIQELPPIPDNLTVPQFLLDQNHPARPLPPRGGNPWLIDDTTGRRVSQEELRARTYGLANVLFSEYGVRENDVVLIFSRNHIDYPVVIWAVHRVGAIVSGANPDYTTDELVYQLEATKATMMFVYPDALQATRAAAERVGLPLNRIVAFGDSTRGAHRCSEELIQSGLKMEPRFKERQLAPGEGKTKLAFLSFSSGTTGKPKAVAIPHIALIANVIQLAIHNKVNVAYTTWNERRFRPGDICIAVLPFYHIYGLVINMHFFLFSALTLVVVPKFNFVGMLASIARHRITHLTLVPPQVVLLCKHPAVKEYDLTSVRYIMVGAAPLTYEVTEQLIKLFPRAHIGQAYGMTETCTAVTMWSTDTKRGPFGSAGQLIPGTVARVEKPDGTLAGLNEAGHLLIKTPSAALCYANNKQATEETFVNGWVRTGDEVKIDEDKVVWVLDRIKEIMKVRGFQVAPAELEGCILDHEDVSDACVVGIPDEYSGELPLAFVVPSEQAAKRIKTIPGAAEEMKASIMKHVASNKVKYKHLTGVELTDAIPKNPSGKLLRRVLRDRAKELVRVKAKL